MIITSPSFNDGETIPKKFTCDGGSINPELQIQNVPAGAKSLALVLYDPDAPGENPPEESFPSREPEIPGEARNDDEGVSATATQQGGVTKPQPELQVRSRKENPSAGSGGGFTHWAVWNISPMAALIKEESVPPGSVEGKNSAGKNEYAGPCPPSGVHRYQFKLYALDAMLDLPEATAAAVAWTEIKKHVITETELVGLYERGIKE